MKKFVVGLGLLVVGVAMAASAAFAGEAGPLLVPDYDRDGRISASDKGRAEAGEPLVFWINDDNDEAGDGDTNSDLDDVPGGEDNDKDCEDDKVNGRCDLLDFIPVLVELRVQPEWQNLTWKLSSESVNVVFTPLSEDHAGDFHTVEVQECGPGRNQYAHEATVSRLVDGDVEIPGGFLTTGACVLMVEGAALVDDGALTIGGYDGDGNLVTETTLKLSVAGVESMYGWMNLRPRENKAKDEGEDEQRTVENSSVRLRLPTSTTSSTDTRHFVLVHGYNTNHEEARGNAAEFFKKIWQSGCDAKFTAVEWRGDESQINLGEILPGLPTFTPNYYVNVENAFLAARPFADACKKLPGDLVLVGHSLGNVLISSAIKDYGLDYLKFVMLNAAVAREAFDPSVYDVDMVDDDWLGEKEKVEAEVEVEGGGEGKDGGSLTNHLDRASRWYRNFADKKYDPYEYRRKLAWRGRFANLPRTVNYYSPSDNVLLNPDPHEEDPDKCAPENVTRLFARKVGFGFWAFSEKMKGTWVVDAINEILTGAFPDFPAMKREGGWDENPEYDDEITEFVPANTRFTPFLDARLKTPGMLDILPAETERVRAQHLGDAIPVESFAAGANPVATLENVNMESFIGENPIWPVHEGEETPTNEWKHSTFREVAFYHTSKLYASLAAVERQRVIVDTDLGSCMDDLFAIDLAARMHKQGKLDLMAVMMNRPDYSDPEGKGEFLKFADRYLASLGLGDLSIGTSMPLAQERLPQTVFNPYWTLIYSNNVTGVGALMPSNRTDEQLGALANAVVLYRRLLNDAPDKSVVICSTGFLNNLKALMESDPNYDGDGVAANGMELIAAKVKELRIMGGRFDETSVSPDGTDGAEYNLAGDPVAAKMVLEGWPSPVVVSPWEVGLKLEYLPEAVLADFPAGTPDPVVRAAYTYWPEPKGEVMNRMWDLATILPLTEGEMLIPLSEKGGIAVDEHGVTTFVPDPASNRCYQVASNMNATAVMNRLREICRTGNPSLPDAVRCVKEAGVDYNGHDLTFKVPKFPLGAYGPDDVHMVFAFEDKSYKPDEVTYDPVLEVFSVHFDVPAADALAGNFYNGTFTITLENEELGTTVIKEVPTQIVQGAIDYDDVQHWFSAFELEAPTNYVPATQMPERTKAIVEATFTFEDPSPETDDPPEDGTQAAVRVVADGEGGYKFQYYAFAGLADGYYYRKWHDFNVGGENVQEIKPQIGRSYIVRLECFYLEDARNEANTLAVSVKDTQDNRYQHPVPQFVGNLVNKEGGLGGLTHLESVAFAGDGEIESLFGDYCVDVINANLAKIDGDDEYATVAEAVAAANGQPVRLLHAASWRPAATDIGQPVKFLNKSCLNLDLSGLPANARAVWLDVDGNNGTLTLELVFADTVVYGTVRTAETNNPVAQALAVKDGKYVYVGEESGAETFIEDGVTQIIDHRGKGMVMPGCTDGHSHYTMKFSLASIKGGLLFAPEDDKTNVLKKLETAALAAQKAGKTCLYGFGWNFLELMTNTPPTLAELDEATHGVSTVIFDQGGHHTFCNSECLRRCGIIDGEGKVIKEIAGGYLGKDENGYATGYAEERVTGYLTRMGGINADELVDDEVAETALLASRKLLLSTGYTIALEGWSNTLHPSNYYAAAKRLDESGKLTLVFPMTYEVEPWQTNMTEQIDYLDSLNKICRTRHVLPEYLKIFMDGVVETKTGAMIKPYVDDQTIYPSFWSVDRLADITRECNAKGLTVHTHVMGDAAIKETADAYIQGGDGTHRNSLVHLRNVCKEDFQRFADNNIACAAGFTWHVGNGEEADAQFAKFLDAEYIEHAYPMKSFFDAGVRVSSHSDFPANIPCPQDPFGIMEVAVTGQRPDLPADKKLPAYDSNELVTVEQAFEALTINGAWQVGLENERGSIKVGKWADFVLADQDVFECAVPDIHKTKVVSTWFEGVKVYQAGSKVNPWEIGTEGHEAEVTAWTNGTGRLVIEGVGKMANFTDANPAPWGMTITDVEFGAQVETVGSNAFAGSALATLTMGGNPPAIGIGNDFSGATLTVRADAKAKFEAADGWKNCTIGTVVPVCYDYAHVKTLAPFLHEVRYDDYVFDERGETLSKDATFSCSSVRNGNFIGRNFDFFLDDTPEFVVHVAADPAKDRLASVGMAMHAGMREDGVTNGQYTASYDLIPNRMLDGINEKGVAINQNVVAFDPEVAAGAGKEFTGTNPGAPDLNVSFVTRLVLDRATNAAHAVELIKARNLVGMSVSGDLLHYMISDPQETYVVEIVTNAVVARHMKVMTNFNLNWDNEHACAVTDADTGWDMGDYPEPSNLVVTAGSLAVATNELAKYYALHAEGVERFVRLRDNYDEGATFEGMMALMRRVRYSQASTFETHPYWYSDRCSVAVDKKLVEQGYPAIANTYMLYGLKYYKIEADPEGVLDKSLDSILEEYFMAYERACLKDKDVHRKENSGVWLTVHNATYDISNRMFRIAVQEDYAHTFDIWLVDRPVPVTPGVPVGPFPTAEAASNAMTRTAFTPSEEVAAVLTTDAARQRYKGSFAVEVVPAADGQWEIAALMTFDARTNLAANVAAAVRQIPLAAIAALPTGETMPVPVEGCEPGFYYTLFGADALPAKRGGLIETALPVRAAAYGPVLSDGDGKVTFKAVERPSPETGFFSVGAKETKGEP